MRGAYQNDLIVLVGIDDEREETCMVELGQDVFVEGKRGFEILRLKEFQPSPIG